MKTEIKTYNPQAVTVSSSAAAWRNYLGASEAEYRATREQIFADFPGCVIVDGDDDWSADPWRYPMSFREEPRIVERRNGPCQIGLGIGEPLAWYHSGVSGISRSGIVITREQYDLLCARYKVAYGCELTSTYESHDLRGNAVTRKRVIVWTSPDRSE